MIDKGILQYYYYLNYKTTFPVCTESCVDDVKHGRQ